MTDFLTTFGVLLLFLVVFFTCILWATRGHPADDANQDLSVVAKDH